VDDGKLKLVGSGTGGVAEMLPLLSEDSIQFAYVVFKHKATKDAVVMSQKFLLITIVGANVGGFAKAKVGVHKTELLAQGFKIFSIEMQANGVSELDDSRIDNYMIRNVDANWMQLKAK